MWRLLHVIRFFVGEYGRHKGYVFEVAGQVMILRSPKKACLGCHAHNGRRLLYGSDVLKKTVAVYNAMVGGSPINSDHVVIVEQLSA